MSDLHNNVEHDERFEFLEKNLEDLKTSIERNSREINIMKYIINPMKKKNY